MRTILDILPAHAASDPAMQEARIAEAYAAVFTGNGSADDAGLVLIDLAQFSRYYDTAHIKASADQVKAIDQRRAVVQRVLEAVIKSGHSIEGLHGAVLRAPTEAIPEEGF